jgi:hypothetical protein
MKKLENQESLKYPEREKYIDGVFSTLYGFDWISKEVIYRQVINEEPVYIRLPNTYFLNRTKL